MEHLKPPNTAQLIFRAVTIWVRPHLVRQSKTAHYQYPVHAHPMRSSSNIEVSRGTVTMPRVVEVSSSDGLGADREISKYLAGLPDGKPLAPRCELLGIVRFWNSSSTDYILCLSFLPILFNSGYLLECREMQALMSCTFQQSPLVTQTGPFSLSQHWLPLFTILVSSSAPLWSITSSSSLTFPLLHSAAKLFHLCTPFLCPRSR